MYPSDYGFAYGAGFGITEKCYESSLNSCGSESTKNWLLDTTKITWTITPSSGDSYYVWYVDSYGIVASYNSASGQYGVRPVIYLKSNISIAGGSGTIDNPYTV